MKTNRFLAGFFIFTVVVVLISACAHRTYLGKGYNPKDFGEVGVYSSPPRASISVDGRDLIKTPAIIGRVQKNKPYRFEVKREGYESWKETVVLQENRRNLNIKLQKISKELK